MSWVGNLTVKVQSMDMRSEVEAALLAVRSDADEQGVDLESVQGRVVADPLRFRQIVRTSSPMRFGTAVHA